MHKEPVNHPTHHSTKSGVALRILGVALKVGETAASHLIPLHAPEYGLFHSLLHEFLFIFLLKLNVTNL